jgi:hypothetical protein
MAWFVGSEPPSRTSQKLLNGAMPVVPYHNLSAAGWVDSHHLCNLPNTTATDLRGQAPFISFPPILTSPSFALPLSFLENGMFYVK